MKNKWTTTCKTAAANNLSCINQPALYLEIVSALCTHAPPRLMVWSLIVITSLTQYIVTGSAWSARGMEKKILPFSLFAKTPCLIFFLSLCPSRQRCALIYSPCLKLQNKIKFTESHSNVIKQTCMRPKSLQGYAINRGPLIPQNSVAPLPFHQPHKSLPSHCWYAIRCPKSLPQQHPRDEMSLQGFHAYTAI